MRDGGRGSVGLDQVYLVCLRDCSATDTTHTLLHTTYENSNKSTPQSSRRRDNESRNHRLRPAWLFRAFPRRQYNRTPVLSRDADRRHPRNQTRLPLLQPCPPSIRYGSLCRSMWRTLQPSDEESRRRVVPHGLQLHHDESLASAVRDTGLISSLSARELALVVDARGGKVTWTFVMPSRR
jgi:hypothetical protein